MDDDRYQLQIPNFELLGLFRKLVSNWFDRKVAANQLEGMLESLQKGKMESFECLLQWIVEQIMSYHDLGNEPEKVYHALVLGMLVGLSGAYEVRSNRESGLGRFDVMLKPKDPSRQGIIIEFKRIGGKRTKEETLQDAMKQIKERKYAVELQTSGVMGVLNIAVAFKGKQLWCTHESLEF